ncbi:hypothetical protein [Allobaculum sp. Allo2]|uniref:hypothetical protein n=1 Tax=Allobaculum sp. Allo2 TaxID=2853432 RepID=UPI001F620FE9|nr:hypothetical protein [Allobaculum sp. Allo2]
MIEELNKSRKIMETDPDDFMQSPVSFLKARQPENVDILPSERSCSLRWPKTSTCRLK